MEETLNTPIWFSSDELCLPAHSVAENMALVESQNIGVQSRAAMRSLGPSPSG